VLGISTRARVAGVEQLMLPPRLRPYELPWLDLKIGEVRGFAPFDWIALSWDVAIPQGTLEAAVDGLGIKGIAWKPFLGPLSFTTSQSARARTAGVFQLDDLASAPKKATVAADWNDLVFVYRDDTSLVAMYAEGPKRLIRFRAASVQLDTVIDEDFATPSGVKHLDLNGDGHDDWILELAGRYGDGFHSVLWVIDGASRADSLRLQQLPLSHSAGEGGSTEMDARWTVGTDRTIEVERRSGTSGARKTVYRYGTRLTEVHAAAPSRAR